MDMNVSMNLGVDAGNISILDLDYVKENGGVLPESRLRLSLNLKPGQKYRVAVQIPNTYNSEDPVEEEVEITVGPSGMIFIGDACYAWPDHDKWMAFLEKTEYLHSIDDKRGLSIDTGGDGEFNVQVAVKAL